MSLDFTPTVAQHQRLVISNALGAADGKPPMHVDLESGGGPLNAWFGRGTRAGAAALEIRDRVPGPVMNVAMKVPGRPEENDRYLWSRILSRGNITGQ